MSAAPLRRLLIATALATCSSLALAQGHTHDKPFEVLPAVQPQPAGKIEVIEFFQYGCGSCSRFEPVMADWKKKLPAGVVVRRVPVAFDNARVPHARIYYTLEALGLVDKLHGKVFEAVLEQKLPLNQMSEIADFMEKQGIDRRKWLDAYGSQKVGEKTLAALQTWRDFQVDGTPAVGVAGKYLTAPFMVGSFEGTIKQVNELIAKERSARK